MSVYIRSSQEEATEELDFERELDGLSTQVASRIADANIAEARESKRANSAKAFRLGFSCTSSFTKPSTSTSTGSRITEGGANLTQKENSDYSESSPTDITPNNATIKPSSEWVATDPSESNIKPPRKRRKQTAKKSAAISITKLMAAKYKNEVTEFKYNEDSVEAENMKYQTTIALVKSLSGKKSKVYKTIKPQLKRQKERNKQLLLKKKQQQSTSKCLYTLKEWGTLVKNIQLYYPNSSSKEYSQSKKYASIRKLNEHWEIISSEKNEMLSNECYHWFDAQSSPELEEKDLRTLYEIDNSKLCDGDKIEEISSKFDVLNYTNSHWDNETENGSKKLMIPASYCQLNATGISTDLLGQHFDTDVEEIPSSSPEPSPLTISDDGSRLDVPESVPNSVNGTPMFNFDEPNTILNTYPSESMSLWVGDAPDSPVLSSSSKSESRKRLENTNFKNISIYSIESSVLPSPLPYFEDSENDQEKKVALNNNECFIKSRVSTPDLLLPVGDRIPIESSVNSPILGSSPVDLSVEIQEVNVTYHDIESGGIPSSSPLSSGTLSTQFGNPSHEPQDQSNHPKSPPISPVKSNKLMVTPVKIGKWVNCSEGFKTPTKSVEALSPLNGKTLSVLKSSKMPLPHLHLNAKYRDKIITTISSDTEATFLESESIQNPGEDMTSKEVGSPFFFLKNSKLLNQQPSEVSNGFPTLDFTQMSSNPSSPSFLQEKPGTEILPNHKSSAPISTKFEVIPGSSDEEEDLLGELEGFEGLSRSNDINNTEVDQVLQNADTTNFRMPDFSSFTTQHLQRKISEFGFKPIHDRDMMIELLKRCHSSINNSQKLVALKSQSQNLAENTKQNGIIVPEHNNLVDIDPKVVPNYNIVDAQSVRHKLLERITESVQQSNILMNQILCYCPLFIEDLISYLVSKSINVEYEVVKDWCDQNSVCFITRSEGS